MHIPGSTGYEGAIRTAVTPISQLSVDTLAAEGRHGNANFSRTRGYLAAALELLQAIARTNFSIVPEHVLKKIHDEVIPLVRTLAEIENFHKLGYDDQRLRDNLENGLKHQYDVLFADAALLIALTRQYDANVTEREHLSREAHKRIESIKTEAEQIRIQLESLKADAIVAKDAEYFDNEAKSHLKHSRVWLVGVAISACTIIGAAYYATQHPPVLVENSVPLTVFAYLPRLLVLTILFYALSLCVRNYRTNLHNHIVNQHRTLALKTFKVFVASARDQKIKDAILAQAAATIFSAQSSGYMGEHPDPLPQTALVDIAQRINSK